MWTKPIRPPSTTSPDAGSSCSERTGKREKPVTTTRASSSSAVIESGTVTSRSE